MSASKTRAALLTGAAMLALSSGAFAADFATTVAAGDTVTSVTLDAPAAGDTHTLQNDGTIVGINGASWDVVIVGSGDGHVVIDNDSTIMGTVDFSGLTGGTTVNNNGTWSMEGWDVYQPVFGSGNDVINNGEDGVIEIIFYTTAMSLGAGDDVIDNAGTIGGVDGIFYVDFGEGNNRFENSGAGSVTVAAGVDVTFGSGDDVFDNAGDFGNLTVKFGEGANRFTNSGSMGGATITFGSGADVLENSAEIEGGLNVNFGGGNDTFENTGALALGGGATTYYLNFEAGNDRFENSGEVVLGNLNTPFAVSLHLDDLETFENSGDLVMSAYDPGQYWPRVAADRIVAPGADFIGLEGSRLLVDVDLAGGGSDGLDLEGGTTSGETMVVLSVVEDDAGSYDPEGVAIVNVAGGTTAAAHFRLDPSSVGYSAQEVFGGGVRVGAFSYGLVYEADTQTHRVVGLPSMGLLRMGMLPAVVQDIWRAGDDAVASRQADLRTADPETAGGLWMQVSGDKIERDAFTEVAVLGAADTADVSYQQDTAALTLGADVLGEGPVGRYALGFMVGPTSTSVEFEGGASEVELEGVTASVYGGFSAGGFFVDASLTGSGAKVNDDNSFSEAVKTEVISIGARAEAGYRFGLGEGLYVEPLVSLVHVSTTFEDLRLPGAPRDAVLYDDAVSTRLGVGGRLGLETAFAGLDMRASLTGRYWSEMEGENGLVVRNTGADPRFVDDFGGDFAEVNATVDLSSPEGAVSGFANVGGRFGEDYRAASAAVGLRYNW